MHATIQEFYSKSMSYLTSDNKWISLSLIEYCARILYVYNINECFYEVYMSSVRKQSDISLIFRLSWPVMLGMVLQSILSTVDVYFISGLGTDQSAAASLSNSIVNVIFVFSTLVSAGTIALISRSKGEGDITAVQAIGGQSFTLSALVGGLISLVCFILRKDLIILFFNPEPAVFNYADEYLRFLFPATILVFINSALRTIFQANGDTRTPLYIFGISNVINGIGDYVLIRIFNFGITGAALATLISMLFSAVVINIILVKKFYNNDYRLFLHSLELKYQDSIRILRIGGWACIQSVARPITGTLMYSLVYIFGGSAGAAAFGIGGQLFSYTFIVLSGLSTGLAVLVGQNLGRKDIESCNRLIRQGMKVAWINTIICIVPYIFLPRILMSFFIDDPLVISHGVDYLTIVYLGVMTIPFTIVYGGVFQGSGDTFPPMVSSMIANVVLKLPAAYFLAYALDMGIMGVWTAIALSTVAEAAIIYFYFIQGKWKEKKI